MFQLHRFIRIKKLQIAGIVLAALTASPTFAQPTNELPNIDRRLAAPGRNRLGVNATAENTATLIRNRVAQLRIVKDELLGSPKSIGSTVGFLTGENGVGGAVSDFVATAIPLNDPHRGVKSLLTEHRALFGFGPEALTTAIVRKDYVSTPGDFRTTIWQQHLDDIPVFEAIFKAHLTRRGELINVGSQFVPDLQIAAGKFPNRAALRAAPPISVEQAILLAAENIGDTISDGQINALDEPQGAEQFQHFTAFPVLNSASARLTWLPMDSSTVQLCWEINLVSRARGEGFQILVDAQTGEVWVRRCFTESASNAQYNVFTSDSPSPFSPGWSAPFTNQPPLVARTLVDLAYLSATASPNGWINDGDNSTAGNNVDAHLDWNNDNVPDPGSRPVGSPFRVFNFPLDLNQAPVTYTNASVVNLFYWNNWMHDQLYALGFDEAAGNFQNLRFGKGGYPGTAVQADAQDASTTNFLPNPPGPPGPPRFNNANFLTLPDGSAPRMQMYLFNKAAPNRDASLDAEIICHEYAHGLSARLVGGGNGISSLQTRGMGEGWSDFFALSLLSDSSDDPNGVYAFAAYVSQQTNYLQNYFFGIRRYPYSTALSKNPLTFKDIDPAQASTHAGVLLNPLFLTQFANTADEVHNMGELWCVTLWEARARLIARLGPALGNSQMLQLVTDGMKLVSSNPTFLEARDSLMQADLVLTGGANLDDLWIAFAKRGMGFGSGSPGASDTAGVIEAFDIPPVAIYPVVAILNPTEQSFHATTPTVSGTANISAGAVWIYLQRMSDNFYFNPTNSTWGASLAYGVASGVAIWSANLPTLPDGFYLLTVRANDGTAISQRAYRYFSVDTSIPTLTVSSPTNGASFASPPTVTGSVTDNYYVKEIRVTLNRLADSAWYNFASNAWGTPDFDFARNVKPATLALTNWLATLPPLGDGGYQTQIQAVDRADNTTTWIARNFTMDTGVPSVTFTPITNTQTLFNFADIGGQISEAGTVTFRITEYDAGGTNDLFWNGSAWISNGDSASVQLAALVEGNSWLPAPGVTLPTRAQTRYGAYFFLAIATDLAGNRSSNEILVFRSATDTTVPLVTLSSISSGQVITNNFLPGINGAASDPESGIASVEVYLMRAAHPGFVYWTGSAWSATATTLPASYNAAGGTWTLNAAAPSGANLINDSYQIQVFAANRESPVGQQGVTVPFTVDYHPVFIFTAGSYYDVEPNNNNMNWGNPANWDVGSVPTADAIAVISGHAPDSTALGSFPLYRLDQSGGTLITAGMVIKKLNLTGGSLVGGAISIPTNGVFNWSAGIISGIYTILDGAVLNLNGSATKTLGTATILDNHGVVNWTGPGAIYNYAYNLGDRASISNQPGAVFNLNSDGQVFSHDYHESLFYNLPGAQFIKSGGTNFASINNFTFFNSGELRVDSGSILFDGTCTLDTGTTLAGNGAVRLTGNSSIKCPVPGTANLKLESGTLTASGSAAYGGSGSMDWIGGTLVGEFGISPGSSLRISGATTKYLGSGAVLNNSGAITWTGTGVIYNYGYNAGDRATVNNLNGATFSLLTDGQPFAHDYNLSWFNNRAGAQFRKDGGAGNTVVNNFIFNNTGEISAATGTLEFNDTLNLGGGGMFVGAGQFLISGGLTTLSNLTTIAGSSVAMTAGTLLGDTTSNGSLFTTNGGSFDWAGGTLIGTVGIAPGSAFKISGAQQKNMGNGAVINNSGTVTWGGAGNIYNYAYNLGDRATINNLSGATFNIISNAAFSFDYNVPIINNASNATFAKIGGGGVTTCGWVFNNSGTAGFTNGTLALAGGGNSSGSFEVGNGGLLRFIGGAHSLTNTTRFAGNGRVQIDGATLLLNGSLTLGLPGQPLAVELITGTLGGTGTLPGEYVLTWTGGTIAGNQTITAGGIMVVTNIGIKTLGSGAVLNNQGAITWFGPGTIYNYGYNFGDIATINNQSNALFSAAADGPVFYHDYNPSVFNNLPGGRFTKSGGTNATSINHFVFNSPGDVRAEVGSLLFDFVATFGPDSSLTGNGTLRWGGDIKISGAVTSATSVILEAGVLTGMSNATYSGNGPFNWTAGALAGTTTIALGSTLNLSDGGKTLASGAVLNNQGTINWSGPGALYNYAYNLGDRATVNNLGGGVFNLLTDGLVLSYDYNSPFMNNAVGAKLRKTGGTGSSTISYTFTNSGAIEVLAGTLNIAGNYASTAASSELDLVLGGLTPGTGFSLLSTTGNLPFDGLLKLTLTNGFTPTNGHSFAIATYASLTGQFAATQLPPLPFGSQWKLTYGANSLLAQVVATTTFQNYTMTNGGNFQFNFVGETGSLCLIEASTNLINWIPVLTNAPFNGSLNFTDPETPEFRQRYYRATIFQ